jgi:PLD-like domain
VGLVSAYVSTFGVKELIDIHLSRADECRLIAGLDGEITHPKSLRMAKDAGWAVRTGLSHQGIFHPKFVLGGQKFARDGAIQNPSCVYVGSANLTKGGLRSNVECGIVTREPDHLERFSEIFAKLWAESRALTDPMLDAYAIRFAERNRQRTAHDMKLLGVADDVALVATAPAQLQNRRPPGEWEHAIPTSTATVGWAGLQSFTGEYQFQIEFPRAAGEVIQSLIGAGAAANVDVECEDAVRAMNFHYYRDNSMFRLNVPFDVPNVAWARQNRNGIAVVSRGEPGGAPIKLRILRPSGKMREIIGRSVALGTWGKTSTRLYGWM